MPWLRLSHLAVSASHRQGTRSQIVPLLLSQRGATVFSALEDCLGFCTHECEFSDMPTVVPEHSVSSVLCLQHPLF